MYLGGNNDSLSLKNGKTISTCSEYISLRTNLNQSGRTENEIRGRIIKGRKVISALNCILLSKTKETKKKTTIFKRVVLSGTKT